jgi:hypothetical protein
VLTLLPQGFYGCKNRDGGVVRQIVRRGGIASAYGQNIFVGDPVKSMTNGTFELAAASDPASAVFMGWQPEDANVYAQTYWKAGTTYVKPPEVFLLPIGVGYVYTIQCAGPLLQTACGDTANWVIGAGNVNSGHSTTTLSATLSGAGVSDGFKILNLRDAPGNAWGDAFTEVEGIFNEYNLGMVPGNAI